MQSQHGSQRLPCGAARPLMGSMSRLLGMTMTMSLGTHLLRALLNIWVHRWFLLSAAALYLTRTNSGSPSFKTAARCGKTVPVACTVTPGLPAHAIPVLVRPNILWSVAYVQFSLCRLSEAWRSEFWPPAAAESALALVSTLARKCAWLSIGVARRQFAIAVPGVRCRFIHFQCFLHRKHNVLKTPFFDIFHYRGESGGAFLLLSTYDTLHQ